MNTEHLIKLGLTKNDVKVYVALLELDTTTTGPIKKKTKLYSSKIYDSLERLEEQGLVSYIVKGNRKYFEAASPLQLKEKVKEMEDGINNIIPELLIKQNTKKETNESTVFEGYKGVQSAFEDILKSVGKGEEYCVMGITKGEPVEVVEAFFSKFYKKRVKKGIKLKALVNEQAKEIGKRRKQFPLTKIKYLSSELLAPAAVNIYKDKVIILSWQKQPVAIMIKSKAIKESFQQFFNALWKVAKK